MFYDRFIRPSPTTCIPDIEVTTWEEVDIFQQDGAKYKHQKTFKNIIHKALFAVVANTQQLPEMYTESWPYVSRLDCRILKRICVAFSYIEANKKFHQLCGWINDHTLFVANEMQLAVLDLKIKSKIIKSTDSRSTAVFFHRATKNLYVAKKNGYLFRCKPCLTKLTKTDYTPCHLTLKPDSICYISAICADQYNEFIITGCSQGMIIIRDANTMSVVFHKIDAFKGFISTLKMSPSNEFLVASHKNYLRVWKFKTMELYLIIKSSAVEEMGKRHDLHPLQSAMLAYVDSNDFDHKSNIVVMKLNSKKIIGEIPIQSDAVVETLSWCPLSGELVVNFWQQDSPSLLNESTMPQCQKKLIVYSNFSTVVASLTLDHSNFFETWSPNGGQLALIDLNDITVWSFIASIGEQWDEKKIQMISKKSTQIKDKNVPHFVQNFLNNHLDLLL